MDNGTYNYVVVCKKGGENGVVERIKEYMDGLVLVVVGIVNNIDVADDIAEDTFVLIGTKKPKFKGTCSFKTWLYSIGRNITMDYLRKHSKHATLYIEDVPEIIDPNSHIESLYFLEERKIIVHKALHQLKKEYRQVLWLMYFEQISQKEIAAIMKKSVHSIETLSYRAKKSLKIQLEKEGFVYENI